MNDSCPMLLRSVVFFCAQAGLWFFSLVCMSVVFFLLVRTGGLSDISEQSKQKLNSSDKDFGIDYLSD